MDYSQLAYPLLGAINTEAISALPGAPVIEPGGAKSKRRRVSRLRGRLSNVLHRAAWALEPDVNGGCPAQTPGSRTTGPNGTARALF